MLVDDDDDDDDDGQASWEDEKGLRHVNNHSPVHMLVVVNTQQKGGLPDQSVTFVEQGEHPLLIGVQISHHVCPFQSYVCKSYSFPIYHVILNTYNHNH